MGLYQILEAVGAFVPDGLAPVELAIPLVCPIQVGAEHLGAGGRFKALVPEHPDDVGVGAVLDELPFDRLRPGLLLEIDALVLEVIHVEPCLDLGILGGKLVQDGRVLDIDDVLEGDQDHPLEDGVQGRPVAEVQQTVGDHQWCPADVDLVVLAVGRSQDGHDLVAELVPSALGDVLDVLGRDLHALVDLVEDQQALALGGRQGVVLLEAGVGVAVQQGAVHPDGMAAEDILQDLDDGALAVASARTPEIQHDLVVVIGRHHVRQDLVEIIHQVSVMEHVLLDQAEEQCRLFVGGGDRNGGFVHQQERLGVLVGHHTQIELRLPHVQESATSVGGGKIPEVLGKIYDVS